MDKALFQQIETLVHQQDNDRFVLSFFAPEDKRASVLALLALNYEIAKVRELVKEPLAGHMRLAWWREAVEELTWGQLRRHFAIEALASIENLPALKGDILQLIEARGQELDDTIAATNAEFQSLCRNTAGQLHNICCKLLTNDYGDHAVALDIGQAWAMIGHLRSIVFQARFRRMYLPLDVLAQHGIDKDRFFDVPSRVDLSPAVRQIAEEARTLIQQALTDKSQPKFIRSLGYLGLVYIERLEKCGFNPLAAKLQNPLHFKLLRVWLRK